MNRQIARITLLVRDYDEAIEFYTGKLGFELLEDKDLGKGKRWVVIRPNGSNECALLMAKAVNNDQIQCVGKQSGGRVFLFLFTDDFQRDYKNYKDLGVKFLGEPRQEDYGTVIVFEDLYGNKWDLINPN